MEEGSKKQKKPRDSNDLLNRLHLPALNPPRWKTSSLIKEPQLSFKDKHSTLNTNESIKHAKSILPEIQSELPKKSSSQAGKDLFSTIVSRLKHVEGELREAKKELQIKDQRIESLEHELKIEKELVSKSEQSKMEVLVKECESQKAQIEEMNTFLNRHGIIWRAQEQIPRFLNLFNDFILINLIVPMNSHLILINSWIPLNDCNWHIQPNP